MAVQSILDKLRMPYSAIELGWARLSVEPSAMQVQQLNRELKVYHLEILENKKEILVEQIKTLIIGMLHQTEASQGLRFSQYVSQALRYDYTYLSNIFSDMQNSTIERFYIGQRIERSKELMIYEGMNVSEISYELNFSNASHFCRQFKKVTGQTPAAFKRHSEAPDFVWRKIVV
jgi:AraC-like DNA-binding protein